MVVLDETEQIDDDERLLEEIIGDDTDVIIIDEVDIVGLVDDDDEWGEADETLVAVLQLVDDEREKCPLYFDAA